MTQYASASVRETILQILAERKLGPAGEHDPLFSSGLLDSLAATEVLIQLESEYGVDLSDEDFDISRIDTLHSIEEMIEAQPGSRPG